MAIMAWQRVIYMAHIATSKDKV